MDEYIGKDYSPEQIVGECRRLGIEMVLHETIYQYIWWDKPTEVTFTNTCAIGVRVTRSAAIPERDAEPSPTE